MRMWKCISNRLFLGERNYLSFVALIVFFLFFITGGCTWNIPLVPRIMPGNDWPKKRIMITRATCLTSIDPNELTESLAKALKGSGYFNVCTGQTDQGPVLLNPGESIDSELIKEARERGINALIFETLNPVEKRATASGIWPLRKKVLSYRVSMIVNILDVESETVILSKEIAENTNYKLKETEKSDDSVLKKRAVKECIPEILDRATREISISLNRREWRGRIISAENKMLVINAGRDAELRPGVILKVYKEGKPLTCFDGKTYCLPGQKVGEIKIVELRSRQAFAEPLEGEGFHSGQIVKPD